MTLPALTPAGLRCAHRVNPLGVAPDRVRFSWRLDGTGTGRSQRAYQIVVTAGGPGARRGRDTAWDSGRVDEASPVDVEYAGGPLACGVRYSWKVRTWDERDQVSDWSEPAWFEVELDQRSGWLASWIGLGRRREEFRPPAALSPDDPVARALLPAPYLRHPFTVAQPVAAARLYITALGLYEARLNGQRVGDAFLAPGWTDYHQRILYQTYDVTGMLSPGENVIGAVLADGWHSGFVGFDAKRAGVHYGPAPELLAQLRITFADGSEQWVATGRRWQGRFGAVRHADLLMGECHDLALEPRGWDRPGFSAAGWQEVRHRARDGRLLAADPGPAVRVTGQIAPASIGRDPAGRLIVDFGQNLPGWLRLRADCPAGTRISVRHAEMLAADGGLYTGNLRSARQTDEFITAAGEQVLEPRFTMHGFRYAEISGYPGELAPADVVARVAHSDIPAAGSFESSLPWLNRLFASIDWGQRGNFVSVPTDCPQRDERLGWLGDAQIFARTAAYNRDVAAFFAKWLDDVADAQFPSGAFPDIAPRLHLDWAGAPAWGDAGVIVPWTVYRMYGDRGILQRHLPAMTAWMEFLEHGNSGYLRTRELGNSYNDWLAPGDDRTPPPLLATAYWAYDAALMAEITGALGRPAESAGYQALWSKIQAAFADAFVSADGRIASETQTAYALGLHMQLIPEDLRAAAAGHLAAAIEAEGWRLTTGFVGVGYLLPVLSAHGHSGVAYRLLEQDALPSWRYMLDQGATTIWERWDGWTAAHGFQSPQMNSFNHYALGAVGEWLYRFVLGIEAAPDGAGFRRLTVRPHPGGSLTWARGSYQSVRGLITSQWRLDGGSFALRVGLPPNVTASIHVPSADAAAVRDQAGAPPVALAAFPGAAGGREAVFEVGSGLHEFTGPALACPAPG
ncbi:MAG: family 78 glycoside hydrolase catalytic domain [Gemmatimonadota bacterium]